MKLRVFLLILLTTLFCCTIVYGECPPDITCSEDTSWTMYYCDDVGNTYSLTAPCKVDWGTTFYITAEVTSTTCGSVAWVSGAWQIIDKSEVILYGDRIWTPWVKVIERTYTGAVEDHTINFAFNDLDGCTSGHGWVQGLIGNITVDPLPGLSLSCIGFEPPLDKSPIKFKKNRVLPLKAQLDDNGSYITDADITAPPVVQVLFDSGAGGEPVDVSDDVLSAGHGTDGNQFVFTDEGKWQFNLKTNNYTASGTYTVSMESGDSSEYTIDSICTVDFVIE